jgi:nucleoside-diphosphate-sugar epimerase
MNHSLRTAQGTVLITGGAGFIGAAFARALAARGRQVVVVDDESAGSFERLEGAARVQALRGSVAGALATAGDVGCVVHLAARVGVGPVVRDPEACREHNVAATGELVAALRAIPGRIRPRLFAASSSEVYLPSPRPLREDDPLRAATDRGRWAYAAAKVACERRCDDAHLGRGRRSPVHLRFFNVVGPGQDSAHGMMLPTFVEHALAGLPIPVHGDGRSVRTLAHVDDVSATLCALVDHPHLDGGPLNIGGTARASVLEVAECVLALSGSRAGIVHVDPRRTVGPAFEDVLWREPDLGRLAGLGVPVPSRSLEEIVADTLERHERARPRRGACVSRAS